MKCPIDNTTLMKKEAEGVFADFCRNCNGVFLSPQTVQAFKYNFETKILETALSETVENPCNLKCPNCNKIMHTLNISKIEIDACKGCKSIWFDENEVRKVIQEHGTKPKSGSWADILYFFPIFPNC